MSNVVKIERNGEHAEVLAIYLQDFLDDGWHKVTESKNNNAKDLKEFNDKANAEQEARDLLVAEAVQRKEDEHKEAMARIQAELDEFRQRETNQLKAQQLAANEEAKKRHEQKILVLDDKDAVADYIKEHFDTDIDKRGSLEVVKEKANKVVSES